jgi:hypothetical protein
MRSNSIYDKAGNNYRYLRALKAEEERTDKIVSGKIWNKIYDQIPGDSNKKIYSSEKKTYGSE